MQLKPKSPLIKSFKRILYSERVPKLETDFIIHGSEILIKQIGQRNLDFSILKDIYLYKVGSVPSSKITKFI